MDVARKLIILGREMGLPLELNDVQVAEPGAARSCRRLRIEEFMARLPRYDAAMAAAPQRRRAARGKVLRYVGAVPPTGAATVGLTGARRHAMPSPTSRSPTTWCALPRAATATIR